MTPLSGNFLQGTYICLACLKANISPSEPVAMIIGHPMIGEYVEGRSIPRL